MAMRLTGGMSANMWTASSDTVLKAPITLRIAALCGLTSVFLVFAGPAAFSDHTGIA